MPLFNHKEHKGIFTKGTKLLNVLCDKNLEFFVVKRKPTCKPGYPFKRNPQPGTKFSGKSHAFVLHLRNVFRLRKLFAITLLSIYLFNLAGYVLLYEYFIARSNRQLVQQIDKAQYNENELITIKMPLNLPYITVHSEYERVDGEIEWKGTHYNYVKRKVQNDTLYLQCLPNTVKTQLYKDRTDFAQQANIPAPGKNEKPQLLKKGYPEWGQPKPVLSLVYIELPAKRETSRLVTNLPVSYIEAPYQPPKHSC